MDNRKPTVKRQRKQDMDIEERNNKTTTKNGDKEKKWVGSGEQKME